MLPSSRCKGCGPPCQHVLQERAPHLDDDQRIDDEENEKQHGDRRRIALVERLEGRDIDIGGDGVGRAGGPARRHDIDEIGKGCDPHGAQHHGDGDGGREERQRHFGELLPGRCAVDGGGFIEFGGNGFARREQRDGEEGNAEPHIGDDRPPHRGCGIWRGWSPVPPAGRWHRTHAAGVR